jgi:hypothetical protein
MAVNIKMTVLYHVKNVILWKDIKFSEKIAAYIIRVDCLISSLTL